MEVHPLFEGAMRMIQPPIDPPEPTVQDVILGLDKAANILLDVSSDALGLLRQDYQRRLEDVTSALCDLYYDLDREAQRDDS